MRVIAGTARSLILKTPEGNGTRPTTDRIKETLFNMLQTDVPGSVFVDLFAGSGGIGIEALSRGAVKAYFAENNTEAIKCIDYNVKHTHFEDKAYVLKQDAITTLSYSVRENADIIFCDPPYSMGFDRMIIEAAKSARCVTEDTLIIIEELKNTDFSYVSEYGFEIVKEKIYKSNKHVFIRKAQ